MLGIVARDRAVKERRTAMTAPRTTIRIATAADRHAMIALLQDADLPTEGVADTPANYLVAAENGVIAALGGLEAHPPDALLRSLVVSRVRRNAGLGHLVFDRLWQQAEAARYSGVYLLTTTAADYFVRLGFSHIERERAPQGIRQCTEFAMLCPASAVLMRRTVSA